MKLDLITQPFPMQCSEDPEHQIARIAVEVHTSTNDDEGTIREINGISNLRVVCDHCNHEREAIKPS